MPSFQHTRSKKYVTYINMELQPSDQLDRLHPFLDELVKAFNIFVSFQEYTIVKRHTKVSKKGVLRKAVLMCDRSKEHIDENGGKKDTTSRKTKCPFNAIAFLGEEGWSYQLCNGNHNYDPILAGAHSAYRNIARTEDILDQIANYAKTGALP